MRQGHCRPSSSRKIPPYSSSAAFIAASMTFDSGESTSCGRKRSGISIVMAATPNESRSVLCMALALVSPARQIAHPVDRNRRFRYSVSNTNARRLMERFIEHTLRIGPGTGDLCRTRVPLSMCCVCRCRPTGCAFRPIFPLLPEQRLIRQDRSAAGPDLRLCQIVDDRSLHVYQIGPDS